MVMAFKAVHTPPAVRFTAVHKFFGPVRAIAGTDLVAGRGETLAQVALLGWVVREGVTNVVRHSRASRARIELRTDGGQARLTITDDGVCLPSALPPARVGTGLRGLSERPAAAGGSLDSGQVAGGGFRVAAVLPVEEQPV
jgi:signal transduction histidine kinase